MKKTFYLTHEPYSENYLDRNYLRRDGNLFLCVEGLKGFFPEAELGGTFSITISTKRLREGKLATVKKTNLNPFDIWWKTEGTDGYLCGSLREVLHDILPKVPGEYPVYFRLIHHH